ncbi:zinc finger protein 878-like [Trichoplusia ni]|uniref:Zinc finger protein 878-like n=1 Tax=Trichoplusia ni TaxID=7111 RepID=A0A7E5W4I1_TRINI|nr:zinc finger protein 878-like [Trichoplusia ni]
MVSYCCVEGCGNNSNNKKKDPNTLLSFHAFPSNPELKAKWLRAIGRPNWVPPNYSRVCSAHFNLTHINYDGSRIRIKDDAFPVNLLPRNSNFEASDVEVCRICLVTDVKLYTIRGSHLETCIDSIVGFSDYNIEGLPNYVCYQCAPCLIKAYKLVEKSMVAQATLLDIFNRNGKINKDLIKEQNRRELKLKCPLNTYKLTTDHHLKYEDDNTAQSSHVNSNNNENIDNIFVKKESHLINTQIKDIKNDMDIEAKKFVMDDDVSELNDDQFRGDDEEMIINSVEIKDEDPNDEISLKALKEKKLNNPNHFKKKTPRKKINGLTPDETDMLKYFDIVTLSLQEQIKEWQKSTKRRITSETVYKCDICFKSFANANSHRIHIASHDPSQGSAECPVCKLRFKNIVVAKSHAKRAHGKKFYCKSCPKTFNNVGVAKKHQRWHSGYVYRCPCCPFTSLHESSLGVHRRRAHAGRVRGIKTNTCTTQTIAEEIDRSKEYRCEECDIVFVSEAAKRLHTLTSSQHRIKTESCSQLTSDTTVSMSCNGCGKDFSSLRDLVTHTRAEHPRLKRHRNDIYPTQCELCGEAVSSRKKHWQHMRRQHPKELYTYRPVISAVCDTCGKGFQNSTKLRLHQLRHVSPTLQCACCPRLFYDKYALARHAATHCNDKPYSCSICGRAFKLRSNLDRHSRVHTDIAPYECTMCGKKFKYSSSVNLHVRTVHYKLPHPPRKKRSKIIKNTDM